MRLQALKARPRRRRLPPDLGERQAAAVAPNVLDRSFEAPAPNRKWIADFTYVWTAEGWLYVAAVVDLFSRRVVGWSMSAEMTAQLVTDALVMAIWRRGKPDALLHHSDRGSQGRFKWSSQRFMRSYDDQRKRRSDRSGRAPLRSPGRPPVAGRNELRRFWAAIASGLSSEDAAATANVPQAVGARWFRKAGGMPPAMFGPSAKPHSGRYLSFAEREEIALLRAQGCTVQEAARRIGRAASTISRELRRNAATRNGGLEYRASTSTAATFGSIIVGALATPTTCVNTRRNWSRSLRTSSWPLAPQPWRPCCRRRARCRSCLFRSPIRSAPGSSIAWRDPAATRPGSLNFEYGMGGKWLQLLKEIAPAVTRAAIFATQQFGGDRPVRRDRVRGAVGRSGGEPGQLAQRREIERAMWLSRAPRMAG